MAGETIKTEAICLAIHPWSRTSHIVRWLTPAGPVSTLVKGAVRPKSAFLGQYALNYTCDILYYARAKGELHALRECSPLSLRERLRGDYRALVTADYFRHLLLPLAPPGPDCGKWYDALAAALDRLECGRGNLVDELVRFELTVLDLAGLAPNFSGCPAAVADFYLDTGSFSAVGERKLRVSAETASYLATGKCENPQIPLDAARVIGVFYAFHLENTPDARRTVLRLISETKEERQ